jgi:hypothetical protein
LSVLASITPRQIDAPDGSYFVRAPTVREALVVMEAAPLAAQGDKDARTLLLGVMDGWFPQKLLTASRKAQPADVAKTCLQMLRGYDEPGANQGERDNAPVEWPRLIGLYMGTYRISFSDTMREPWPAFLDMLRQVGMVEARWKVGYLSAKGIPHIRAKREREKRMSDLLESAGMGRRRRRKISARVAQANLRELELQFALFGALGRA